MLSGFCTSTSNDPGALQATAAMYHVACSCASAITQEMKDWVALGGGNSGCCGNSAHTYGFHRAGNEVPTSDYSRSHEPGKPYNMNWACAGDFAHSKKTTLLAYHARLIARLLANDPKLSMICEFIGKPFADRPVYYWARWNGTGTLKKYTGSGHDTWSHVSWWRSRANERAYLWTPAGSTPTPVPENTTVTAPAYPGYVIKYNPDKVDANLKVWQTRMKARGWTLTADGVYGPETKKVVLAFQKEKGLGADAEIGPITWKAAWTSAVT